jgi:hypothetical protein
MDAVKDVAVLAIESKLNRLSGLRAEADTVQLVYQERIDTLMAPVQAQIDALLATVQPQMDALQAERSQRLGTLTAESIELQVEIEREVKSAGQSIKGDRLHAIFNRGRETWDGKSLNGYAAAHPEILPFRKIGEPYVTFRDR